MSTQTHPKEPQDLPSCVNSQSVINQYERHFEKGGPDECWEWKEKSRNSAGYGVVRVNGRLLLGHRVSYYINRGPLPDDKPLVLHDCHNRACQNPNHLHAGTHRMNMKEASEHGSLHTPRGEDASKSKLTEEDVIEIRVLAEHTDMVHEEIGDMYDVDRSNISRIVCRDTWTHI
jgi:hypothetical protein